MICSDFCLFLWNEQFHQTSLATDHVEPSSEGEHPPIQIELVKIASYTDWATDSMFKTHSLTES